MLNTRFALECQARFLFEKRSKLYVWYSARASQKKIVPGAKKPTVLPALLVGRLADAEGVKKYYI